MSDATYAQPEHELVVCCARASVGAAAEGRIEALLQQDLDWELLVGTAYRHAMKPLLYWILDRVCPEAIPETYLHQLRDDFQSNGYHNLLQTRALLKVLWELEAQGITAVPFKGPVLAQSAYGNLSLRYFRDLDILVRESHVLAACESLVSLGYQPLRHLPDLKKDADWRPGQLAFVGEAVVELHWDIAPRSFSFPLDPEHLWGHLRPLSLGGSQILTPSPEDLLLLLCVHGTKHRWERLAWICDVANLIDTEQEIDWERAVKQARTVGLERMLFLGLFLASDFLGVEIPEGLEHRMRARPVIESLARQVQEWLFLEGYGPSEISSALFHLRAVDHWGDRLRYGVGRVTATSQADREAIPLPRTFSFLRYLYRPIRLLRRYRRPHKRLGKATQHDLGPGVSDDVEQSQAQR